MSPIPAMAALRLAAAAFLGRLWLADSPRAGLRLIPFIFIKTARGVPENAPFSGMYAVNGLKKTFFSGHQRCGVYFRLTVVRFFSETASFEYGV